MTTWSTTMTLPNPAASAAWVTVMRLRQPSPATNEPKLGRPRDRSGGEGVGGTGENAAMTDAVGRFGWLQVDCSDPATLASFWAAALGVAVRGDLPAADGRPQYVF